MIAVLLITAAATWQNTAALDRAVAAFAGHSAGEEGGARTPVDPRLRLAGCPTVALSWRTPAQDAGVVSCSGPDWRIFVPVRRAVPLAAAPAVGRALPAARAEPVIRRNDPVVIEAGTDGFSVTREGVSMGDAAPGARFLVRIDGSPRPVQAVAIDSGRATLPGWASE